MCSLKIKTRKSSKISASKDKLELERLLSPSQMVNVINFPANICLIPFSREKDMLASKVFGIKKTPDMIYTMALLQCSLLLETFDEVSYLCSYFHPFHPL